MSRGGIIIFGLKKTNLIFPLDLLLLLYYIHYHGDWWLYLTENNDWPSRGLKVPPRGGFTLKEVQAMSRGGIINFGKKIQKVDEFSTRFFMSALLHDWWLYLAEDNDRSGDEAGHSITVMPFWARWLVTIHAAWALAVDCCLIVQFVLM